MKSATTNKKQAKGQKKTLREVGVNVLLMLASTVLVLGMAELGLRLLSPIADHSSVGNDFYMPDQVPGWRPRPNLSVKFVTEYASGNSYTVKYSTNEHGY